MGPGAAPVQGRPSLRHEHKERSLRVEAEQAALAAAVPGACEACEAGARAVGSSKVRPRSRAGERASAALRTGLGPLDRQLTAALGLEARALLGAAEAALQRATGRPATPSERPRSGRPGAGPASVVSAPGWDDAEDTALSASTAEALEAVAGAMAGASVQHARSDLALGEVEVELGSASADLARTTRLARAGAVQALGAARRVVGSLAAVVGALDGRLSRSTEALRSAKAAREEVEASVEEALREEVREAVAGWQSRLLEEQARTQRAEEEAGHLRGALDALSGAVEGGGAVEAGRAIVRAQAAAEAEERAAARAEEAFARAEGEAAARAEAEAAAEAATLRAETAETELSDAREELEALRLERSRLTEDVKRARAAAKAAESAWMEPSPRGRGGADGGTHDGRGTAVAAVAEAAVESDSGSEGEGEGEAAAAAAPAVAAPVPAAAKAAAEKPEPTPPAEPVHRVACAAFRSLLPGLGQLPRPPVRRCRAWARWCFRAMLCAKRKADGAAERRGAPAPRWPDFAYAWLDDAAPLDALVAAGMPASALPQKALGLERAASRRSGGALTPADVRRWSYFYAVLDWAGGCPEGRLALALLDETAGADGARFAVFCASELRAGDGDHAPAHWGPHALSCDYSRLPPVLEAALGGDKATALSLRAADEQYRRNRRPFEPEGGVMLHAQVVEVIGGGGKGGGAAGQGGLFDDGDDGGACERDDAAEALAMWKGSGLLKAAAFPLKGGEEDEEAAAGAAEPGGAPPRPRKADPALDEDDTDEEDAFVPSGTAVRAAAAVVRVGTALPSALRRAIEAAGGGAEAVTEAWLRRAAAGSHALLSAAILDDGTRAAVDASGAEDAAQRSARRRAGRALRRSHALLPPSKVWLPLRSALAAVCRCLRYAGPAARQRTVHAVAATARPATGRLDPRNIPAAGQEGMAAPRTLEGEGGHEAVAALVLDGGEATPAKPRSLAAPAVAKPSAGRSGGATPGSPGAVARKRQLSVLRATASAALAGPARAGTSKDVFCVELFETVSVLLEVMRGEQRRRSDAVEACLQRLARSGTDGGGEDMEAGEEGGDGGERLPILGAAPGMSTTEPHKGWWSARMPPPWTPLLEALRPDVDASGQRAAVLAAEAAERRGADASAFRAASGATQRRITAADVDVSDSAVAQRLLDVLAPGLPASVGAGVRRAAVERAKDGSTSALDLLRSAEEAGITASPWALRLPLPLSCGELNGTALLRRALEGATVDGSAAVAAEAASHAHADEVLAVVRRGLERAPAEGDGSAALTADGGSTVMPAAAAVQGRSFAVSPLVPLRPSWAWSKAECGAAADVVNARLAALERDLSPWLGPSPVAVRRRARRRRWRMRADDPAPAEVPAGWEGAGWDAVLAALDEGGGDADGGMAGAVAGLVAVGGDRGGGLGRAGSSAPAVPDGSVALCWSLPMADRAAVSRVQRARAAVHRALDEALEGPGGAVSGASLDGRQALRAYVHLLRELAWLREEVLAASGLVGGAWRGGRGVGGALPAVSAASAELDALEGLLRHDAPSLALLDVAGAPQAASDASQGARPFSALDAVRHAAEGRGPTRWAAVARAGGGVRAADRPRSQVVPSPMLPLPVSAAPRVPAATARAWSAVVRSCFPGDAAGAVLAAACPAAHTHRAATAVLRVRLVMAAAQVQRAWREASGGWVLSRRCDARRAGEGGVPWGVVPALGVPRAAVVLAAASTSLAAAAHAEAPVRLSGAAGGGTGTIVAAGPAVRRALATCGWLACPAPGDSLTHALTARAVLWGSGRAMSAGRDAVLGVDPARDERSAVCEPVVGRRLRAVLVRCLIGYAAGAGAGAATAGDESAAAASVPRPLAEELSAMAWSVFQEREAAAAGVWAVLDGVARQSGVAGEWRVQTAVADEAMADAAVAVDRIMEDDHGDNGGEQEVGAEAGAERDAGKGAGVAGVALSLPDQPDEDEAARMTSARSPRLSARGSPRVSPRGMSLAGRDPDASDEAEALGTAAMARAVGAALGASACLLGGRRWGLALPGGDRLPNAVRKTLRASGCEAGPSGRLAPGERAWELSAGAVFLRSRRGVVPGREARARLEAFGTVLASPRGAAVLAEAAHAVAAAATPEALRPAAGADAPAGGWDADMALLADAATSRIRTRDAIRAARPWAARLLPQAAALLSWRLRSPPDAADTDDCLAESTWLPSTPPPGAVGVAWLFEDAAAPSGGAGGPTVDAGWVVWCLVRAWAEDSVARVLAARAVLASTSVAAGGGGASVAADGVSSALAAAWTDDTAATGRRAEAADAAGLVRSAVAIVSGAGSSGRRPWLAAPFCGAWPLGGAPDVEARVSPPGPVAGAGASGEPGSGSEENEEEDEEDEEDELLSDEETEDFAHGLHDVRARVLGLSRTRLPPLEAVAAGSEGRVGAGTWLRGGTASAGAGAAASGPAIVSAALHAMFERGMLSVPSGLLVGEPGTNGPGVAASGSSAGALPACVAAAAASRSAAAAQMLRFFRRAASSPVDALAGVEAGPSEASAATVFSSPDSAEAAMGGGAATLRCSAMARASLAQAFWGRHGQRASDDAAQAEIPASAGSVDPEAAWRTRRARKEDVEAGVALGAALERLSGAEEQFLAAWAGADVSLGSEVAMEEGLVENGGAHADAVALRVQEAEGEAFSAAASGAASAGEWGMRHAAEAAFGSACAEAIGRWRAFRASGAFLRLRGRPGLVESTA